jgi:hypothetical protein
MRRALFTRVCGEPHHLLPRQMHCRPAGWLTAAALRVAPSFWYQPWRSNGMRASAINRIRNRGKHRCACRSRLTDYCSSLPRYSAKTKPHPRSRRTPIRGARYTTKVAGERRDATLRAVISALHQSLVSAAFVSRIYNMVRGRSRARAGAKDDGEGLYIMRSAWAPRARGKRCAELGARSAGLLVGFAGSGETKPLRPAG